VVVLVIKAEFQGRGRSEVEKNYKHKAAEFPLAAQFPRRHKLRIALSQLNHRTGVVSALEKALQGQTRIFGFPLLTSIQPQEPSASS
jgi:hypothetical protein